jgi:hypothetical protein
MIAEVSSIQEQLQQKLLIFWSSLSTGLLATYIAWRLGLFKPFEPSFFPLIRGKDVLKGFGYFLFIEIFLIPALAGLVFLLKGKDPNQLFYLQPVTKAWINLWIMWGGFGGVLIAYFEMKANQRRELWLQTEKPWYTHLGIGIIAWLVSYPLVLAFSEGVSMILWYSFHYSIVEQIAVQNIRQALTQPVLFGLTAFTIVTLIPLTEEFLFRGLLQSWLKHKLHNTPAAIVISSLIFAFFHYSSEHGFTNIELLSSLFLLSCMLGYIYERQRSLWAPIGLHSFFNLVSLLVLVFHPNSK